MTARLALAAVAAGAALPFAALAWPDFAAGIGHPIGGLDHLLAMLAVGLWAVRDGRVDWVLPAVFMAAMLAGGTAGFAGLSLPGVETGILASLLAFGALVALRARLPLPAAMAVVAGFALFHGHAHGAELPEGASPLLYAAGFLAATAILHLGGIAAALVAGRALASDLPVRVAGGAVAASGALLLAL